ncbi:MAG: YjjG family noncanonical pyrimidine nucleotidase [Duncaniella sp.]|nr:YjjG family noncanonical pyrimidine nucleotidase [Duncaniella sp.]
MKSKKIVISLRPSVVWLDLDDTLIDFHANSRSALRLLYDEAAISRWIPSADTWVEDYEKSNVELWRRYALGEVTRDYLRIERMRAPLRSYFKGSDSELDEIAMKLDPWYLDLLAMQKGLVDGAQKLLTWLREHNYRIGILSNGFEQVQYRKMDTAGITPYIDITVLSDHIGINKPAIGIYRHAMEMTGERNPGRHLLVGDNLATDIAGAVNAGWDAVYFDRNAATPVTFNGRYYTINSLSELVRLLPD